MDLAGSVTLKKGDNDDSSYLLCVSKGYGAERWKGEIGNQSWILSRVFSRPTQTNQGDGKMIMTPQDLELIEAFMNLPPFVKLSIYVVIVYVISLLIVPTRNRNGE